MTTDPEAPRILYWIMCAAPPVQDWREAARQLQEDGWDLHAIPTQTAASWLDLNSLANVTGHAVRTRPRLPHEADELPPANAVLVAPATFNTVNQWAAGINDTLPLGLLNELLGLNVPIVVAMYCKAALAAHPAYRPNIRRLSEAGASVLDGEHSITVSDDGFSWTTVRATLGALPRERPDRDQTIQ
jgi:phosphopantothenoylcysteine synthetase/decarboxylase